MLMGSGNKLSNIFYFQLLDQVPAVCVNGQWAEEEFICDHQACLSLGEETQNLLFSPGKLWYTPKLVPRWAANDLHDLTAVADISPYRL